MKKYSENTKDPGFVDFYSSLVNKGRFSLYTFDNKSNPVLCTTIYLDGDMTNSINGYAGLNYLENNPKKIKHHFDLLAGYNDKLKMSTTILRNIMTYLLTAATLYFSYRGIDFKHIDWTDTEQIIRIFLPAGVFGIGYFFRNYLSTPIVWAATKWAGISFK